MDSQLSTLGLPFLHFIATKAQHLSFNFVDLGSRFHLSSFALFVIRRTMNWNNSNSFLRQAPSFNCQLLFYLASLSSAAASWMEAARRCAFKLALITPVDDS